MKNRRELYFAVILMIGVLALWGCPKKADMSAVPEEENAPAQVEQKAPEEEEAKERSAAAGEGLQPIYFDFDKSFVRDDARSVMKANADWLKANPKVKVRIEGMGASHFCCGVTWPAASLGTNCSYASVTDMGISA